MDALLIDLKSVDDSNILSGIISGIVVAIVIAVVSFVPKLRAPVLQAIKTFIRWVTGIRITTARAMASQIQVAVERADGRSSQKVAELEAVIAAREKQLSEQRDFALRLGIQHQGALDEIAQMVPRSEVEASYRRGVADTQVQVNEERARPLKAPRWQIDRMEGGEVDDWVLMNHATDSVATNVVLGTAGAMDFTITSDAQWDDVSGPGGVGFTGTLHDFGAKMGARLAVEWSDANGDVHHGTVTYRP